MAQPNCIGHLISFFEEDYQARIKLLEEVAFDTPWQDVQKLLLQGLADYCISNPWVFAGLAAVRADIGVAKRHEQTLDFFATRYVHLLKIGGFAVRGEEEARVSRTYVLLLDSFMFAVGRAEGSQKLIEEVIEDYLDVIISHLSPKMQTEENRLVLLWRHGLIIAFDSRIISITDKARFDHQAVFAVGKAHIGKVDPNVILSRSRIGFERANVIPHSLHLIQEN